MVLEGDTHRHPLGFGGVPSLSRPWFLVGEAPVVVELGGRKRERSKRVGMWG